MFSTVSLDVVRGRSIDSVMIESRGADRAGKSLTAYRTHDDWIPAPARSGCCQAPASAGTMSRVRLRRAGSILAE